MPLMAKTVRVVVFSIYKVIILATAFVTEAPCQNHAGTTSNAANIIGGEPDYDYQDVSSLRSKFPSSTQKPKLKLPISPPINGATIPKPTPIPILKQINRHNEDGSYTYGFEGADGSFKIETKSSDGEVFGKYGYVDDGGKLRVVEYGANKYGFRPSGEGITVPAPTMNNDEVESKNQNSSEEDESEEEHQKGTAKTPIFQAVQKRKQTSLRESQRQRLRQQQSQGSHEVPAAYDNGVSPNIYREESKSIMPFPYTLQKNERHRQMHRRPQNVYQSFDDETNAENQQALAHQVDLPIPKIFEPPQRNLNFESQQIVPEPSIYTSHPRQQSRNYVAVPSKHTSSSFARGRANSQPSFLSSMESASEFPRSQHGGKYNQRQLQGESILDQLFKQYGLPPNGSPAIQDLFYGYY